MSNELLTGLVVGVFINIITGLFSRKMALIILPWLCYYIAITLMYEILTQKVIWGYAMETAQGNPSLVSYLIVILISASLGGLYWKSVNKAVNKLEKVTAAPIEQPKQPTNVLSQRERIQKESKEPRASARGIKTQNLTA